MAIVWMIVLAAVLAAVGTYAWGAFKAAPFVPTRQRDVERMLTLADIRPGELVYDLGAGDARFLLTAATKFQAQARGYEISLVPYLVGKFRLLLAGVSPAMLKYQDFYRVDLSAANVVVCFLTPAAMAKLVEKFQRELRPGTRIVSYAFSLPGWTLVRKDKPSPKVMAVYVYRR